MNEDKECYFNRIISQQAQRIIELEMLVNSFKKKNKKIHGILYNIGAPLNDNLLGYSNKQLKPFFEISENLY